MKGVSTKYGIERLITILHYPLLDFIAVKTVWLFDCLITEKSTNCLMKKMNLFISFDFLDISTLNLFLLVIYLWFLSTFTLLYYMLLCEANIS